MNWVDVSGFPGSGKSTLCDPFWGPHSIPINNELPPAAWSEFLSEITRIFGLIEKHPTFPSAIRMTNRTARKMSTVARMDGSWFYLQTGWVQRLNGAGWRMADLGINVSELRRAFELVPISIGVAILRCDPEIVKQRNRDREKVATTAHENRSHMVDLMRPAIEFGLEVLRERGVPTIELSTEQPIADARRQLVAFAMQNLGYAETVRSGDQASTLPVAPRWWRH